MVSKSFIRTSKIVCLIFLCFFGLSLFVPKETKSVQCGCGCGDCILWDPVRGYYVVPCCQWWECPNSCSDSVYDCWTEECHYCTSCSGGGCFTGETGIQLKTEDSKLETKEIKDLKPGDVVESFNPETGEIKEGTVSDVTKTTREGYYILETESGEKVKVTAEHPFLAIKSEKSQEPINQVSNFKNQLKEIFSNTLTYRFLANLQAKFAEAF